VGAFDDFKSTNGDREPAFWLARFLKNPRAHLMPPAKARNRRGNASM